MENLSALAHYQRLTAQYRDRGSLTSEGFSNHLPMVLGALLALGATTGQLDAFARGYAPCLPQASGAADEAGFVDFHAAQTALRQASRLGLERRYLIYFDAQLAQHGLQEVLRVWLPQLWSGAAAAAFHGLIRTAYGAQFANHGEVASGLAVWAAAYMEITAPAEADGAAKLALPADQAVQALLAHAGLAQTHWSKPLIASRMREVATHAAFAHAVGAIKLAKGVNIAELATACAWQYAGGLSFTAMHCVTALHAVLMLADAAPPDALQTLWPAIAAALIVARSGAHDSGQYDATLAWPRIVEMALAASDDHLAKPVHSFQTFHVLTVDAVFLHAMSRLVTRGRS